jgi:hypothetical protein
MAQVEGKTFRILGRLVDSQSQRELDGLRVEAWDKEHLIADDLLSYAVTDRDGAFEITSDESRFRDRYPDREPDLFFKVFHQDKLIRSTEDSVLWNVAAKGIVIVIEVDAPAIGESTKARPRASRVVKRAGMTTSIQTDIRYNPNRVYRLVGRDLYSAPAKLALTQQEFNLEEPGLIGTHQTVQNRRVIVREGNICLEG